MTGSRRSVGRPRTRLLDREGITQAARKIILTNGANALTMSSLANELKVTPSALYNHAESKLEILDWIKESIYAEIDISSFDTKHWVKGLEDWANSYLSAMLEHREMLQLVATHSGGLTKSWQMYERVTRALVDGGWPIESSLALIEALESFIFGTAVRARFHHADADNQEVADAAPTYMEAIRARASIDEDAERSALFRIGFYSILSWSAEQLRVDLDDEGAPDANKPHPIHPSAADA